MLWRSSTYLGTYLATPCSGDNWRFGPQRQWRCSNARRNAYKCDVATPPLMFGCTTKIQLMGGRAGVPRSAKRAGKAGGSCHYVTHSSKAKSAWWRASNRALESSRLDQVRVLSLRLTNAKTKHGAAQVHARQGLAALAKMGLAQTRVCALQVYSYSFGNKLRYPP